MSRKIDGYVCEWAKDQRRLCRTREVMRRHSEVLRRSKSASERLISRLLRLEADKWDREIGKQVRG